MPDGLGVLVCGRFPLRFPRGVVYQEHIQSHDGALPMAESHLGLYHPKVSMILTQNSSGLVLQAHDAEGDRLLEYTYGSAIRPQGTR